MEYNGTRMKQNHMETKNTLKNKIFMCGICTKQLLTVLEQIRLGVKIVAFVWLINYPVSIPWLY
jgi:hypothetical protein